MKTRPIRHQSRQNHLTRSRAASRPDISQRSGPHAAWRVRHTWSAYSTRMQRTSSIACGLLCTGQRDLRVALEQGGQVPAVEDLLAEQAWTIRVERAARQLGDYLPGRHATHADR